MNTLKGRAVLLSIACFVVSAVRAEGPGEAGKRRAPATCTGEECLSAAYEDMPGKCLTCGRLTVARAFAYCATCANQQNKCHRCGKFVPMIGERVCAVGKISLNEEQPDARLRSHALRGADGVSVEVWIDTLRPLGAEPTGRVAIRAFTDPTTKRTIVREMYALDPVASDKRLNLKSPVFASWWIGGIEGPAVEPKDGVITMEIPAIRGRDVNIMSLGRVLESWSWNGTDWSRK